MVGERVEMRIVSTPARLISNGFGMLKSKRSSVPAQFDPAGLLAKSGKRRRR